MKTSACAATACISPQRQSLKTKSYEQIEPTLHFVLFFFSEPVFILTTSCPGLFQSLAWELSGDEVHGELAKEAVNLVPRACSKYDLEQN